MNGTSKEEDPVRVWNEIEMEILQIREDSLRKLKEKNLDSIYKEINRGLIIILEKFARALARLFTLADFGDFAKQASPLVYDYLMLMDNDLGTRNYST